MPSRPDRSAAIIAASSTIAPRAVFTSSAPGRSFASRSAPRKPRVSSVSSRCTDSTSLSANSVSRSTNVTPGADFGERFQAITRMPDPAAMRATSAAMPPKPSRPSVLPVSCHALGAHPLAARACRGP